MGFFWAAYEDGTFSDVLVRDLTPLAFQNAMAEMIGSIHYDWVVELDRPIGLFLGNAMAAGRGAEVQVDWMPWATPRDKLEATAVFLREVPKQLKVFIFSSQEHDAFFARLSRYRLLRNGCKVLNYFGAGKDATMYYTVPPL